MGQELSMKDIAGQCSMLLAAAMGDRERRISGDKGLAEKMRYVDIIVSPDSVLTLDIDAFSERHLMPAIHVLAKDILTHEGPITFCHMLSAACAEYDGVCVGAVKAYDIQSDTTFIRVGVAMA
jgi:hypothetical protein